MGNRYVSAFVGLALVLIAWASAAPQAEASTTGWASSAGGLSDTPVRVPSALLLAVFALAVLGGLFLLLRKPSGPSALQRWFRARQRAAG
jgi:hypothetical protein